MPTADVECGNACGYIEEIGSSVTPTATVHKPKKSTEQPITAAAQGVVATRRYCILKDGHGGGHSFRTQ